MMMTKTAKLLVIGAFVGLSYAQPTICNAWSLNPFASNEEKKESTTYVSTATSNSASTSAANQTSGKSFWQTIGLSKSTKKPVYQSATPKRPTTPQKKKSKSWFGWGKTEEEKKADDPHNVPDWLGKTAQPNLFSGE